MYITNTYEQFHYISNTWSLFLNLALSLEWNAMERPYGWAGSNQTTAPFAISGR